MLRTAERSFQRKNIGHAAEKQFWKGLRIEDFLLAGVGRMDWPSRAIVNVCWRTPSVVGQKYNSLIYRKKLHILSRDWKVCYYDVPHHPFHPLWNAYSLFARCEIIEISDSSELEIVKPIVKD